MIFDSYFNESLLFIMACDKKNRERIQNFLSDFPYELYEKACEAIDIFNEYESNNIDIFSRDIRDVSLQMYGPNNYMYWFSVDIMIGTLNIGRSINGVNDINITLYSSSAYDVDTYRNLGYINYGNSKTISYEYLNSLFGKIVISSRNGSLKKYTKVNDQILNEVNSLSKVKHSRVRKK